MLITIAPPILRVDGGCLHIGARVVSLADRRRAILTIAHLATLDGIDPGRLDREARTLDAHTAGTVLAALDTIATVQRLAELLDVVSVAPERATIAADQVLLSTRLQIPTGRPAPRGSLVLIARRALGRDPTARERDSLSRCWRGREVLGVGLRTALRAMDGAGP